jgi:hypothetical protein
MVISTETETRNKHSYIKWYFDNYLITLGQQETHYAPITLDTAHFLSNHNKQDVSGGKYTLVFKVSVLPFTFTHKFQELQILTIK